ncbi:MAG TPA: hypothetical protein VEO91_13615 [Candidatus Limnocylindria bacterium]|nr:hypothetical protein [Candidatus Limnocylindria bacterium]
MTGPFRPSELDGAEEPLTLVELAQALGLARDLEAAAVAADARPTAGFSERVMAAVAAEPLPRPLAAFRLAARQGRAQAAIYALVDAWRLAWSGGRPLAARAQALAVVLVLVVGAASVSGIAIAGVSGMLRHSTETTPRPPSIVVAPSQEVSPSPTPSAEPSATPKPQATSEPTATPKRSTPRPTVKPVETPEDDDDHGGGDLSGSGSSSGGGESEDVSTPHPSDGDD